MLAFVIILSWCFIVACGCALGFIREAAAAENELSQLEITQAHMLSDYSRRLEHTQTQLKDLLEYTHKLNKEKGYRTFDDIVASLPAKPDGRGFPRYYEVLQRGELNFAASCFMEEVAPQELMMTRLAFNRVVLLWCGREIFGWERNGWVLFHKEVFEC